MREYFTKLLPTHETGGIGRVSAHLSVDLDEALHADHLNLVVGQSVLQTVADDEDEGEALSQLVRTTAGVRSPHTSHLVQHPVLRGVQTLQMLLRTASLQPKLAYVAKHVNIKINPTECEERLKTVIVHSRWASKFM